MPKVELHRHLEGDLSVDDIVASQVPHPRTPTTQAREDVRAHAEMGPTDRTLAAMLDKFETIGRAFTSRAAVRDMTQHALKRCAEDNIQHVELRFSPLFMAHAHQLDPEEMILGVIEGVQASHNLELSVRLILVVERQMGSEAAERVERWAEKYRAYGVAGLDLANDELHYPPRPYESVFARAKKAGLHITVHAGECRGRESVLDAVDRLHADRVGHAVQIQNDPDVLEHLRAHKTTLELCPTSNVKTGAIRTLGEHPLPRYLPQGQRVTINTDDPSVFQTSLSTEFMKVIEAFDLSLDDLHRMLLNAVDGAFLEETERNALRERVEREFWRCADVFLHGPAAGPSAGPRMAARSEAQPNLIPTDTRANVRRRSAHRDT